MAEEHGVAGPVASEVAGQVPMAADAAGAVGAMDADIESERVALNDVEAALVEVAAALDGMG